MPQLRPDLVNSEELIIVLPELLGLSQAEREDPDIARRVGELESEIEEARRMGRLIRYKRTLEHSGTVIGYVYKRADLVQFIHGSRTANQLVGDLRNRSQRMTEVVPPGPLKLQRKI